MLAYTFSDKRGDLDMVLFKLSEKLAAKGLSAAGLVQINTERCKDHACDMDVKVLPAGPVMRISQSLGKDSRGCRLDTGALETAVGHVTQTLTTQTDVLIINKFGKLEAGGRGFRNVIGTAIGLGVPVISGVNALNRKAFLSFSDGCATELSAEVEELYTWLVQQAETRLKSA